MDQPTKTHRSIDFQQHRLFLEKYTLLTEDDSELRAKRDAWYAFYRPSTPGEFADLNTAVMAMTAAISEAGTWPGYASWLPQVADQISATNGAAFGIRGHRDARTQDADCYDSCD